MLSFDDVTHLGESISTEEGCGKFEDGWSQRRHTKVDALNKVNLRKISTRKLIARQCASHRDYKHRVRCLEQFVVGLFQHTND